MVCKLRLQVDTKKMEAKGFVDRARHMATRLEDREAAGSGSRMAARSRAAHFSGIPASIFYSLRYRFPKTISIDVFDKLCAAVERQAETEIGKLQDEIVSIRARRCGFDESAVSEAEAALVRARELLQKARA